MTRGDANTSGTRRQTRRNLTKARISDVARVAGVSTATVSRALSFPDRVQDETRARVLSAVRTLGYTPNGAARQLRAGSSQTILVVVPARRNPPFFSEVLRGIDVELSRAGYAVLMGNLDSIDGKERHLIDLAFGGHIDGALILSGMVPAEDGRSIADAGIPIVAVCAETANAALPTVVIDDMVCALAQTRYLTGLGHRRLLYVSGPPGNYNELHRYRGFQQAAREAGVADKDMLRVEGTYVFPSGVAAGEAFLAMANRPTGVVIASDEMAIAFMKTVRRAGVRVPEDVSVIGFDGIEFGDFVEPALTTISQPRFDLGATGARILLDLIRGDGPVPALTVLKGELVTRDSAGPRRPPSL